MNGIVSVKFVVCLMFCVYREKKYIGMYILFVYIMDFIYKLLVKFVEWFCIKFRWKVKVIVELCLNFF